MTEEGFVGFRKIPRWSRDVIVTEKIDGTNGCIYIGENGEFLVGSRTRWLTPECDNYGFAKWAIQNKETLMLMGPGRHFGEWWGSGIQRGYGLKGGDRRFSLFNVSKWCKMGEQPIVGQSFPPSCVDVVPVLWKGSMDNLDVNRIIDHLVQFGSSASLYMNPEGIVIYHVAGNISFKKTIDKDNVPKGDK